jgi:outer membrane protein OmpA-like peptidoglycan-associated protein
MIVRVVGIALVSIWPAAMIAQAVQLPPPRVMYAPGRPGKVTGFIVNRDGDDLLVRDETTSLLSMVTLTSATSISSPSGFLNLERTPQPPTTLIAGLLIAVQGTGGSQGDLVADRISFRESALRVAKQIAAGEVVLKAQQRQTAAVAAANRDSIRRATLRGRDSLDALNARISSLDKYVLRVRGTVTFAVNSAELSEEAREILDDLVDKSRGLEGYMIEVAGYSDATGSVAANQAVSARRAQSVVEYLNTERGIPLRRIATATGLGSSQPVGDNATAEGRALNRRAEVRVLVNRGLRTPPPQ